MSNDPVRAAKINATVEEQEKKKMFEVSWLVGMLPFNDYFKTLPEALRFVADRIEKRKGETTSLEISTTRADGRPFTLFRYGNY